MISRRRRGGRAPRRISALRVFAIALPMLAFATAADGAGPYTPPPKGAKNPLLVPVALNRCSRLIRSGGREVIYNACSSCRIVSITRKRPGIAVPVNRTFNVQGRSQFPVPFRGPGRSRITTEQACEGVRNLVEPTPQQQARQQCVELKQTAAGGVVLVNSCKACRGVAIQRQNIAGKPLGRQVYKMEPQSIRQVKRKGAAKVGVLADIPCPS